MKSISSCLALSVSPILLEYFFRLSEASHGRPLSQIFTPCRAPSRRLGHRRSAALSPSVFSTCLGPHPVAPPEAAADDQVYAFAFSGFSRQQQRAPVPIYSPVHHSAHARLALIHDLFCACHKSKCSPLPYRSHVHLAPVRCSTSGPDLPETHHMTNESATVQQVVMMIASDLITIEAVSDSAAPTGAALSLRRSKERCGAGAWQAAAWVQRRQAHSRRRRMRIGGGR